MTNNAKLILIGGTSHVGKSTIAKNLADDLGWNYLSTDQLARHPGRPWKANDRPIPDDVIEHYTNLTTNQLVDSVIQHYSNNVWPIVHSIIQSRLNNPYDYGLVLEGSAILPDMVSAQNYDRVKPFWLTAPEDLIAHRIMQNSQYEAASESERRLIEAFLKRTVAINTVLLDSAEAHSQRCVDSSSTDINEVVRSAI